MTARARISTTVEQMHERYRLDPETGRVFWRVFRNGRQPGDEAFKAKRPNGTRQGRLPCGTITTASVVVFAMDNGRWPQGIVSHENGDITDNRPANLVEVEKRGRYRRSTRSDSASGVKGVSAVGAKWRARAVVGGKLKSLGTFETEQEAEQAVKRATAL